MQGLFLPISIHNLCQFLNTHLARSTSRWRDPERGDVNIIREKKSSHHENSASKKKQTYDVIIVRVIILVGRRFLARFLRPAIAQR